MKIKYYLLLLIFACLGLTSFSSAYEAVSVNLYGDTNNRVGKPSEISSLPFAICGEKGITIYFCMASAGSCSEYTFNPPSGVSSWAGLSSCIYVNNSSALNYWKYFYASQDTTVNFYQLSPCSSSSCDYSQYESTISTLSGSLASCQSDLSIVNEAVRSCQSNLSSCQSDLSTCVNTPSGGLCSNTGTVSDLTNKILLYTGEVALNNSSYKNIFNYGDNGAGTYCVKLSSSSPQTLTFGFANGGTTAPSNLYTLYNDQYSEIVCLYGNKPYFNAKLNSSSNTVSYEIYKLSDLYSSNVCLENECPSCPSCPSCEDCSQYQEDLLSCQEDNESLENMNTSLNDQLQSCLLNGGNGCDPEIDSGCVVGSQLFNLFWSHNGNDFSLPITNNLFLLSGMKASSDSGVVILGTYDSPIVDYSMDSDSSNRLINLVVGIFSILSGIVFIIVAGYYLKKFLNYVLFPYKK